MKRMLTILAHPLFAASVAVAFACAWAASYTGAQVQARLSAESIKPWAVLARVQMADLGSCEARARSAPQPSDSDEREDLARLASYDCAAAYLLAQPLASPAVASQALGYAASVAERRSAQGRSFSPPANYEALYAKAATDARLATKQAERADAALLAACDGLLSSAACSLAQLTPDRPERRLGDSMRDFEIDVHAQHYIALHPRDEAARHPSQSPAYAQARLLVRGLP